MKILIVRFKLSTACLAELSPLLLSVFALPLRPESDQLMGVERQYTTGTTTPTTRRGKRTPARCSSTTATSTPPWRGWENSGDLSLHWNHLYYIIMIISLSFQCFKPDFQACGFTRSLWQSDSLNHGPALPCCSAPRHHRWLSWSAVNFHGDGDNHYPCHHQVLPT